MFHLCRTFEDPDITHVEGEVDPVRDLDIINEELRLKVEPLDYMSIVFSIYTPNIQTSKKEISQAKK